MYGQSPLTSAPSASTAAAPPPYPITNSSIPVPRHQRHASSRSNSFSSASIVTVKRTNSLSSSSTGARNSALRTSSQNPADLSWTAARLSRDRESLREPKHSRRRSVAVDTSEHVEQGSTAGLSNLNRWSHSTNSSVASLGNTKRHRTSSSAAAGMVNSTTSPQKRNSRTSNQPLPPTASPERTRRPVSKGNLTALPPLHATPGLTPSTDDSPTTINTITTPSIHSSNIQEYFAPEDGLSLMNKQKPLTARNYTAPISTALGNSGATSDVAPAPLLRSRTADKMEPTPRPSTPHDTQGSKRPKTRDGKEKDKKAMLSKALQQANTAVLLDNAQNFEGALESYNDACRLLSQVMDRSTAVEDKRKLEAIRVTYTNRIAELRQLEMQIPPAQDDKGLPARPMSDDSLERPALSPLSPATLTPTTNTRSLNAPRLAYPEHDNDSFFTKTMEAVTNTTENSQKSYPAVARASETKPLSVTQKAPVISNETLQPPQTQNQYMPKPLSPRKTDKPEQSSPSAQWDPLPEPASQPAVARPEMQSDRPDSEDTTSWLNTIDEKTSSRASSVHSLSSINGMRRKHIRGTSGGTDPDFDAAFDAAVEAAYDEGLEPDLEMSQKRASLLAARKKLNSATVDPSTGVREISALRNDPPRLPEPYSGDLDDDEEEAILESITSDLGLATSFNFDPSSKSALPRQSDSSGYSRSTWQSSQASVDRATATTSLSTVAEDAFLPRLGEKAFDAASTMRRDTFYSQGTAPPPTTSLPPLPKVPSSASIGGASVRTRRLSGQSNLKNLKIETASAPAEARKRASTFHHSPVSRTNESEKGGLDDSIKSAVSSESPSPAEALRASIFPTGPTLNLRAGSADVPAQPLRITTSLDQTLQTPDEASADSLSARPILFRKNKSSLSLRAEHTLLLSPTNDSAPSLITPLSGTFMGMHNRGADHRDSQRAKFSPPHPGVSSPPTIAGTNDILLFDTSISNAANQPPPQRSTQTNTQPSPLEPCPESFLLRPFWLMRALASTLTHPRGGFLTTRLFVSREVWQTKGVKLKAVEDKIANCDFLTAALGRLAGVDSYDADAIMEELQSFEEAMERVQMALGKKLGNEVGVQGISGMFKDAAMGPSIPSTVPEGSNAGDGEKTKSKESKGGYLSWRKLRNKSSGAHLSGGMAQAKNKAAEQHKDIPTMPTVPMTTFVPVERRGHRKDARNLAFDGPHKEYMGSLARLLEGAQVLDQIARQVEDPGLKHSSPTHVGLELSVRHAAEFFGFFVCRFVLADLGLLLEKFVKRGTEWVLV